MTGSPMQESTLIRSEREGSYKPDDNVLLVHTGSAGGQFAQDWE